MLTTVHAHHKIKTAETPLFYRSLPPRSMVGQLTLDQHIGVRIPGGQPDFMRFGIFTTSYLARCNHDVTISRNSPSVVSLAIAGRLLRAIGLTVTRRIYEAKVLFAAAVYSAESIPATALEGGQLNALVSIVFSVMAVEAFLNESIGMALFYADFPDEPEVVSVFAECMADARNRRVSLDFKLALANWILVTKKLDKGAQPYQDFEKIVRLRNDLVHFKGNPRFEQNATPEEFHQDLIQRFGNRKNLLAQDMEAGSWIHAIETKAIADWSCKTAAQVVVDLVSKAPPEGAWQNMLRGFHGDFVRHA